MEFYIYSLKFEYLTKLYMFIIKIMDTYKNTADLFLFGLVWQYSSVQAKYNKGMFKVMATYLQQ